MEVLVCELNVDLSKLEFVAQHNRANRVPRENAMLANFVVVDAVADEGRLREQSDDLVGYTLLLLLTLGFHWQ